MEKKQSILAVISFIILLLLGLFGNQAIQKNTGVDVDYVLKKGLKQPVEVTTVMNGYEVTYLNYDDIMDGEDAVKYTELFRCELMYQTLVSKIDGVLSSKDYDKDIAKYSFEDKIKAKKFTESYTKVSIKDVYKYNNTEIANCSEQLHETGVILHEILYR